MNTIFKDYLTVAEKWALVATAIGFIHHIDHVLRFDHSGWPFRAGVNAFTYSLLIYPLIVVLLFARGRRRLRVTLAFLLFLFPTLAHIFIETPFMQYRTWASRPEVNLLGVSSPVLGTVAVVVTVLLSTVTFVMLIAFLRAREPSPETPDASENG